MSPLRAHRSPRGFSSFAGCQNSAEPSEGRGAWACGSPRPRGTSPPSRVGAPLAGSRGNWGCCPTEQVWRRAAGGGGAGASRRLVAAPAPRPRAPRSPGEVASWRAGCGAAGPGSAAGLAAAAVARRAPGGARRPSPAPPLSRQLRLAPPCYLFLCLPPPPRRAPQLRPPGLAAPPGPPPARPPAARALPPLLCDEGRVSDLTEPLPPPPRGAAGMEPLSHRGLPRLSWIDTLYSSTCAREPGRPGGKGPGAPRGAPTARGPGCRACSGSPARAGGCLGPRDRPQMGSSEPPSSEWNGS